MSTSLSGLVPEIRGDAQSFVQVLGSAGLQPRITSTIRTHSEQERLYRAYLRGERTLPVAPPGTSAHEFGWAFDLVVTPLSLLPDAGALWSSWGGWWGGKSDPVHFQLPGNPVPTVQKGGFWSKALSTAADYLIGLYPAIGAAEFAATLLSWGFPENQVFAFVSGPFEYLVEHQ